jgi:hypothetical protein
MSPPGTEPENMIMTQTTVTKLRLLALDAADLLRPFSADLAAKWSSEATWTARVDLAYAFAAGFKRTSDSDDPHPAALAVIEVAELGKRLAAADAKVSALRESMAAL